MLWNVMNVMSFVGKSLGNSDGRIKMKITFKSRVILSSYYVFV